MATQGIVSILKDGETVIKMVAGCNGYLAKEIAETVRTFGSVPPVLDLFRLAASVGFGSSESLVIITTDQVFGDTGDEDELNNPHSLYRKTFADPKFNPRWERGTADYVEVVDF